MGLLVLELVPVPVHVAVLMSSSCPQRRNNAKATMLLVPLLQDKKAKRT